MKDSEIPQFFKPYESTIAFNKTLFNLGLLNGNTKNIIDIGTGIGANLQYFSNKNNHINFLGTDYDYNRLNKGRKLNKNSKIKFKYYNALKKNRSLRNKFEGVICIHTLCCFKNLDKVLTNICKINANWIAINSLFFDGTLDVLVHIRDHENNKIKDDNPNSDFNIFSLVKVNQIFKKNGYKIILKKPYFPKKKIKQIKKGKRGSYTIKTDFNKYTTFSGPVHLPWYFVVAKKIK